MMRIFGDTKGSKVHEISIFVTGRIGFSFEESGIRWLLIVEPAVFSI